MMINLSVYAGSFHGGRPMPPDQGTTLTTTEVPSPSTIKGFVESFVGKERGWFKGRVAFGLLPGYPKGRGTFVKKGTYWSTGIDRGKNSSHLSTSRVVKWEILIDMGYRIVIDGDPEQEAMVRKSLKGENSRYGILSLGTSEDEVYQIDEEAKPVHWVVKGTQHPLTLNTNSGFSTRNPETTTFDLQEEPAQEVPETAWINYGPASVDFLNLLGVS